MEKYNYTKPLPNSFDPQKIERIEKLCKLEADIEDQVTEMLWNLDVSDYRDIIDKFFVICHQAFGKEEFYEILTRFIDAAKQ